jgi:hypothetical protein
MKVNPEIAIQNNKSIARKQAANENRQAGETGFKSSDFDKITIASNDKNGIPDAQFIMQLKKSILAEIQAGSPEHKLDDLKQQIALNQYDINIPDIVRKIMPAAPEAGNE